MVVSEQILHKNTNRYFTIFLCFSLLSFHYDTTHYKIPWVFNWHENPQWLLLLKETSSIRNQNSCRCQLAYFKWPDLSKVDIQDFSAPEEHKWSKNTWMNHKFSCTMDTCLFSICYRASPKVSHGATKKEDHQTHQNESKSKGQA